MKKTAKTLIASIAASTALFAGTSTIFAHGTEVHKGALGAACPGAFYQEEKKESRYRQVLESMSAKEYKDLTAAKKATEKYQDIKKAKADGYVQEGPYAGIPAGGMGVHFTRFDISGDKVLDPTKPESLLYEPQADGSFKLIGIEYHVDATQVKKGAAVPSIFGQKLDGSMLNHHETADKMTCQEIADPKNRHYDLHVWLWNKNPNGLFAMWNPNIKDRSAK